MRGRDLASAGLATGMTGIAFSTSTRSMMRYKSASSDGFPDTTLRAIAGKMPVARSVFIQRALAK